MDDEEFYDPADAYEDECDEHYLDDYDDDPDDPEEDLLPCPCCGADIFEDSVQCPICGEYVTFGANAWYGRSWVWVVLGLLGIAATIWVFIAS